MKNKKIKNRNGNSILFILALSQSESASREAVDNVNPCLRTVKAMSICRVPTMSERHCTLYVGLSLGKISRRSAVEHHAVLPEDRQYHGQNAYYSRNLQKGSF